MRKTTLRIVALLFVVGTGAAQDPAPPKMSDLIAKLGDSNADVRDRAAEAICEHATKWSKEELDLLAKARESPDAEVASRAKDVVRLVQIARGERPSVSIALSAEGRCKVEGIATGSVREKAGVAALRDAVKARAKPPVNVKLEKVVLGLYFGIERSTPFSDISAALRAALSAALVGEISLVTPPAEGDEDSMRAVTLTLAPGTPADSWKEKFLEEVSYHYQTQQLKNREIQAVTAELEKAQARVKALERELADLKKK